MSSQKVIQKRLFPTCIISFRFHNAIVYSAGRFACSNTAMVKGPNLNPMTIGLIHSVVYIMDLCTFCHFNVNTFTEVTEMPCLEFVYNLCRVPTRASLLAFIC